MGRPNRGGRPFEPGGEIPALRDLRLDALLIRVNQRVRALIRECVDDDWATPDRESRLVTGQAVGAPRCSRHYEPPCSPPGQCWRGPCALCTAAIALPSAFHNRKSLRALGQSPTTA